MRKPMTKFKIYILFAGISIVSCNSSDTFAHKVKIADQQIHDSSEYDNTVFEDIFRKLNSGDTLAQSTIDNFSKRLDTRAGFFDILKYFNKTSLFPIEYISPEKAAESRLTNWLEYPTELDTIPSKIELIKKVDHVQGDTDFIYLVFKFKTDEPHWAAKNGWMIGVVGPYFKNSNPYDWPEGTFSRFTIITETTPEEEVKWVHKNIYLKSKV